MTAGFVSGGSWLSPELLPLRECSSESDCYSLMCLRCAIGFLVLSCIYILSEKFLRVAVKPLECFTPRLSWNNVSIATVRLSPPLQVAAETHHTQSECSLYLPSHLRSVQETGEKKSLLGFATTLSDALQYASARGFGGGVSFDYRTEVPVMYGMYLSIGFMTASLCPALLHWMGL
jgi:hypothetical protein